MSLPTPPGVVAALLAELRATCDALYAESDRLISGSRALRQDGHAIRQASAAIRAAHPMRPVDVPLTPLLAAADTALHLRTQARDLAWRCYLAMSQAQDAGNHAAAARLRRVLLRSRARYRRRRLAIVLPPPGTRINDQQEPSAIHAAAPENVREVG